jgi:uncharacterized membrane protein
MEHSTESETIDHILDVVEYFAIAIELLAVAVIVIGIAWATYSYLAREEARHLQNRDERYRHRLGRTLLVGLEVLVAADIVRTVATDPTLESVAVLGALVVIRTFLSWALVVEMEHRWPWQRAAERRPGPTTTSEG